MGIQFGICNFDGEPVDRDVIERVESLLTPYAPDGVSVLCCASAALLFGAFDTGLIPDYPRPYRLPTGGWMMWDGRLDNRDELGRTYAEIEHSATDVEIVARIYERLGDRTYSQLIGDWAVSLFVDTRREIVLARDFLGIRPLFYRTHDRQVAWSTLLEPLVFLTSDVPKLSESYLAGWMSSLPDCDLTPYQGVWCVPPCSVVRIQAGGKSIHQHWDFDPSQTIRYPTDREYEEQFHSVFRESVRRRIQSAKPVLAELSGGMDSSSIVCMADSLHEAGDCEFPRLDTVTYFDAREPNWDELPYARIVEQKRGRNGTHIDVGADSLDENSPSPRRFRFVPTSPFARSAAADSFSQLLLGRGHRVVLSGLGGDEILGGVPTPIPELGDLLVRLNAIQFFKQSFAWAVAKRKPILGMWASVLRQFLTRSSRSSLESSERLPWLEHDFVTRNSRELSFPSRRTTLTGALPSFQANLAVVENLRSQLSCLALEAFPPYEWRYPFLDRDLVSFCLSIPRGQIVRPRERRSLMRRSLAATVPGEILGRKRKAYVSRALVTTIRSEYDRLGGCGPLLTAELGIVSSTGLTQAVRDAEQGLNVATMPLFRALALEVWLRDLEEYKNKFRSSSSLSTACAVRVPHLCDQRILGREN